MNKTFIGLFILFFFTPLHGQTTKQNEMTGKSVVTPLKLLWQFDTKG
ncbi:MAG: hypothetical protein GWN62_17860 [Aliifodinibius sp.]|nr:hypothetical protein [Fodinibius sp.]